MCDTSGWSPEVFCGPKGRCENSVCVCEPGWTSDLTLFKQRNCWLPEPAIEVIDGVVGALSLIVFVLVVRESFRVKSHARTFMRLTAIGMLCAAGFCLAHYLEGGTFGPASIILLNLAFRSVSDGIALALYHMLKSFWKMAGKGKLFKRMVVMCQVLEFVSMGAASVAMIVLIDNDSGFTIAMTVFFLLFSLHFAGLLMFLMISTSTVINTVKKATGVVDERKKSMWETVGLASRTSNLGSESKTSTLAVSTMSPVSEYSKTRQESFTGSMRQVTNQGQNLLDKVKRYRNYGKYVGPFVIVVVWVMLILQWSLGSVPLLWTAYAVSILHFPLIGLVQLLLGKSRENPSDRSNSDLGRQLLLTSSPSSPTGNSAKNANLILGS